MSTFRSHRAIHMEQHSLEIITARSQGTLIDTINKDLLSFTGNPTFCEFQKEYIDIIPQSWTVISVTLNEAMDELLLSKTQTSDTPFMLRIPLNRQNTNDCEEVSFDYPEAKQELKDIIDAANQSSQDSKNQTSKAAKNAWWDIRTELDERLRDLLQNMESIWLGGFRGIFSPERANLDLLSRFHQSLQASLDRHLPSRRPMGKSKPVARPSLSVHVLQLFRALGAPDEGNDIDEQVLDLLYFVVDILQFKGERNAYDEIDFDSVSPLILLKQFCLTMPSWLSRLSMRCVNFIRLNIRKLKASTRSIPY